MPLTNECNHLLVLWRQHTFQYTDKLYNNAEEGQSTSIFGHLVLSNDTE